MFPYLQTWTSSRLWAVSRSFIRVSSFDSFIHSYCLFFLRAFHHTPRTKYEPPTFSNSDEICATQPMIHATSHQHAQSYLFERLHDRERRPSSSSHSNSPTYSYSFASRTILLERKLATFTKNNCKKFVVAAKYESPPDSHLSRENKFGS